MTSYRISQLAERFGVPASTLRFYEGAGLLPAERTVSGYRVYDDAAVARLTFITSAKNLGLALDEIRELLVAWDQGICAGVRARMLPLVQARIGKADQRIAELSAFSARLSDVHQQLSGSEAPAGACRPGCGCFQVAYDYPQPAEVMWQAAPVACSLDGSAMPGRIEDWRRLLESANGREVIDGGIRITFPADPTLAVDLTRLAAAEQDCCAFFDFTLRLTPGATVLSVRAPDAGRDLLAELFGATA